MIVMNIFKKILKRAPDKIKYNSFALKVYNEIFNRDFILVEKKTFRMLKDVEGFSSEKVKEIQEKKLLFMLQYAYYNTEYYKRLFDVNGVFLNSIDSLKKIPELNKEIIKKNTGSLISKSISKTKLGLRNTGGSTGEPLEFYSDLSSGAIDNAHHWYLYSLMGYEKGDVIIGGGGHSISYDLRRKNIYWKENEKGCVWGELKLSVLYLSDSTVQHYVDKIIEMEPAILRGYPSFYAHLAQYIIDNDIDLHFRVKGINLTAEMCSLHQRKIIEKAFSSQVYFEYGQTELSLYCYTSDASYIYRSSPIYGYIEVLDNNGNDVPVGEVGRIVATSFNNYGMPFIRYDTGDMGELLHRNGGVVHFKKIVGRNQDYIVSRDMQKIYLTALIFGQHLRAFRNIVKWQVVQNYVGLIEIKIVKGEFYSLTDEVEIRESFESVANISVEFEYVGAIPLTKRGKHLFLIQNIK